MQATERALDGITDFTIARGAPAETFGPRHDHHTSRARHDHQYNTNTLEDVKIIFAFNFSLERPPLSVAALVHRQGCFGASVRQVGADRVAQSCWHN